MWQSTCVPSTVYNVLYKFKPIFRCAQAGHFWVFCWVLMALILDTGKGTLKGLCQYLPPKLQYWTLMRKVRSGQWNADILVARKDKRGQNHPLGLFRRESDHDCQLGPFSSADCDRSNEVAIKELKGGLHLGQMQVTSD